MPVGHFWFESGEKRGLSLSQRSCSLLSGGCAFRMSHWRERGGCWRNSWILYWFLLPTEMTATSKIWIIARKGKKKKSLKIDLFLPQFLLIFLFSLLTGVRHYKCRRGVKFPLPSADADLLILQGLWSPSEMLSVKMYSEKIIRTANFQMLVKKYLHASSKENSV